MPQNRPYIGPERSAATVTSSQLSGTNNTGSHHQSAPAVLAQATPAQQSHSRHSEHRSRRSHHAEAVPAEMGTLHSRRARPGQEFAPASHHSRHGTNRTSSVRASSHREPSRAHGHDVQDVHQLAHEHAHDIHDRAHGFPSPAFDAGQEPRMEKVKGKKVIGDDERVPSMLWYFSGGTGPPPTGKQFRKMTREKKVRKK